jgi:hypothetical protein
MKKLRKLVKLKTGGFWILASLVLTFLPFNNLQAQLAFSVDTLPDVLTVDSDIYNYEQAGVGLRDLKGTYVRVGEPEVTEFSIIQVYQVPESDHRFFVRLNNAPSGTGVQTDIQRLSSTGTWPAIGMYLGRTFQNSTKRIGINALPNNLQFANGFTANGGIANMAISGAAGGAFFSQSQDLNVGLEFIGGQWTLNP